MFCERQMTTNDGKWYRVRIVPCRINNDAIEGVVISFCGYLLIQNLELKLKNS
jgi:two-component system, chemotaxis family, CheB/CheR fusion protein